MVESGVKRTGALSTPTVILTKDGTPCALRLQKVGGLDDRLRAETGMAVSIAENPLSSVALGSGRCIEEFETLQQVLSPEPR